MAAMVRLLGSVLCFALLACDGGVSASRRDGAFDGMAAATDAARWDAFDLAPARDHAADSALDEGARDAQAPDTRDANVSWASGQDAKLDLASHEDAHLHSDVIGAVADAPWPDVDPPDTGVASFCTGSQPRFAANGHSTGPAIRSTILVMDCCEGFELEIVTATFLYSIYVRWVVSPSSDPFPLDIDLSAPASLRSLHVLTNCDSTRANCSDVYQSGFVGRLQLSQSDGGIGYDGSLCIHAEEPADSPHPHLHSFDLYLPRIAFR